jgi:23S rRNA (pseudouridine1915-N3)-methyltransferase
VRLILLCVGRASAGAENEMSLRYIERANAAGRAVGFSGVELRELEASRARRADDRKCDEAKALLSGVARDVELIAFDEGGKLIGSRDFARHLGQRRDAGAQAAALVIGGADGLAASVRDAASLVLSFGAMTFPHQLARIMAAEQIYRAITILSAHPYHRD